MIHALHDGLEQKEFCRLHIRQVAIDHPDTIFLAVMLECGGYKNPSGNSTGIKRQNEFPAAILAFDVAEQRLKVWPIVVLAGLDCIGVLIDDNQPALNS